MPDAPDAFPPIGGYGFLSDCHTSALVSFDGAIEWLCLPRFDSPSVFGAMLDRDAGHFTLRPKGVSVPISRRYIPGTLVIETTWVTDTGWLLVHDALSIAARNTSAVRSAAWCGSSTRRVTNRRIASTCSRPLARICATTARAASAVSRPSTFQIDGSTPAA